MNQFSPEWTEEARERLKQAARAWGKQQELANALGMPKNTLHKILTGTGDPGISRIAAIARVLGVSVDYILTGEGSAEHSEAGGEEDLISLPMVAATLSAGPGSFEQGAARQAEWVFPRIWLHQSFGRIKGLELMRVRGDSQEPDLSENDWVMVDTTRSELRDGLHALLLDEELLLKRVQVEGRFVRLLSRNPDYGPITVDRNDESRSLRIIGRVVWSSRVHSGT